MMSIGALERKLEYSRSRRDLGQAAGRWSQYGVKYRCFWCFWKVLLAYFSWWRLKIKNSFKILYLQVDFLWSTILFLFFSPSLFNAKSTASLQTRSETDGNTTEAAVFQTRQQDKSSLNGGKLNDPKQGDVVTNVFVELLFYLENK